MNPVRTRAEEEHPQIQSREDNFEHDQIQAAREEKLISRSLLISHAVQWSRH